MITVLIIYAEHNVRRGSSPCKPGTLLSLLFYPLLFYSLPLYPILFYSILFYRGYPILYHSILFYFLFYRGYSISLLFSHLYSVSICESLSQADSDDFGMLQYLTNAAPCKKQAHTLSSRALTKRI